MGNPLREIVLPVVRPLAIALVLATVGFLIFSLRPQDEEYGRFTGLAFAFGGVFFFIAAAAFLLVPLGRAVVGVFESLFNPGGTYTPPALHRLPEWYCSQGRYQEAAAEYEKILSNYPRDAAAWIGLINVTVYYMGNRNAGEKILHRVRQKLKKPADLQSVEDHFRTLTLSAAPTPQDGDSTLPPA